MYGGGKGEDREDCHHEDRKKTRESGKVERILSPRETRGKRWDVAAGAGRCGGGKMPRCFAYAQHDIMRW